MCCTNDLCGTRRREEMDAYPCCRYPWRRWTRGVATDEFGDAFAPNSELASNEFLIEFAFKIRKIPSGFALVRQCREQATAGRTHASMSDPENIETAALHRNPENTGTVAQHWAGKIHVRRNKFQ